MELLLNCESAKSALDTVTRITSAEHANLEVLGKDIWIGATGSNKSVKILVKGEVIEESPIKGFGFNTFTLNNILKGRAEVKLIVSDNDVNFRSVNNSSKFSGNFHTVPFEDITILEDENVQEVKMKGTVMTALLAAVKKVSLSNLFTTEPMTLFVRYDDTGLYATVYDNYHLAYSYNPNQTNTSGSVEFSVTLPLFEVISSVAQGQDYTLSVGPVYVSAKSLGFELSLPTLQSVDDQSFEQAQQFVESLDLTSAKTLNITIDELKQTLESLSAVSDPKASNGILVEQEKGTVKFSLRSSFGNAVERRRIELEGWDNTHKFTLSPQLFKDVLQCYPGDQVIIHFQPRLIIFQDETGNATTTYTCLLM